MCDIIVACSALTDFSKRFVAATAPVGLQCLLDCMSLEYQQLDYVADACEIIVLIVRLLLFVLSASSPRIMCMCGGGVVLPCAQLRHHEIFKISPHWIGARVGGV